VLDNRVAQDGDSKEMLGIIRDNLYFDFGFIYSDPMKGSSTASSGPFAIFGDELRKQTASYTSPFKSVEEIFITNLADIMAKFAD
jgi:hypothetical protein